MNFKIGRIKRNLSQEELSKISGVSRTTISKIETKGIEGIRVSILRKLASSLDIKVNEIFFEQED